MKRLFLLLMVVCAVSVNAQNRHTSRTADPAEPQHNERRDNNPNQRPEYNPRMQQPMWVASPEQVMLMVEQLNKISFSQDQVGFAIFCVRILPVPAEGIMRLASAMQYDNSKLEFLKEAYRHCPDTNNFKVVEEALSFKSSVDELRSYIDREYKTKYY